MLRLAESVRRVSDRYLDIHVRLAILDEVAGHPNVWVRKQPGVALEEARSALGGAGYMPTWFSDADTGLVAAIRRGAMGAKKDGLTLSPEEIEDAVMRIIGGFTAIRHGGVLAELARKVDFRGPSGLSHVKHLLGRHAWHRAISELRTRHDAEPLTEETDEQVAEPVVLSEVIFNSAVYPDVKRWLRGIWAEVYASAPSKVRILDLWLGDPSLSYTTIARMLNLNTNQISGDADPAYVSRVMREALAMAETAARVRPRGLPDTLVRTMDLMNLNRGRAARQIR